MDGDGRPLAGKIDRGNGVEYWWIPSGSTALLSWITVAIGEFRKIKPEVFPSAPDWHRSGSWQIPVERNLQKSIESVVEDRDAYVRLSQLKERQLRDELASASVLADQAERRLLTAQGDELLGEVAATLTELGFEVVIPDLDPARRGDKLEDLRVRDSDHKDWVALAEVRGYKRGAAINDLLRIGRFVARFAAGEKRLPDRK
jgi:hypothetical protein